MDKRTLIFAIASFITLFGINTYFDNQHQEKMRQWTQEQKIKKEKATQTPLEDEEEIKEKVVATEAPSSNTKPTYYVLENAYQQLVFSNIGGALIEINLPFHSENNEESAVRAIELDKEIKSDHPYNAYFPAHPYFTPGEKPEGPFTAHESGSLGGYYPLLRRDLIESGNWKTVNIEPRYFALNLHSDNPEISELVYTVKHFDKTTLILEATYKGRKITKTFSLPEEGGAPYVFDLSLKIEGDKRNLWLSSGIPEVELFSGNSEPVLKYRITRNQSPSVEVIPLPTQTNTNSSVYPDWLCNSNGFFGIIMDPLNDVSEGFRSTFVPGTSAPSRLVEIDQSYNRYQLDTFPGYQLMLPVKSNQKSMNVRVYAGPISDSILRKVDAIYSDPTTGYTPDYVAAQSYHGYFSFISEPFAKFLFLLMSFFHQITHSWGFSIILLTVALRLMMWPLNQWATKSMVGMQQMAPEITAIQERHKKDPQKAQKEIMQLYQSKGVNPLSGCVPLLIQIPFLIGMFDLLKTNYALRGASFIPGWIDDLAAPDVLFSWDKPLFFIGNQFHLLPFILGGAMYLQTWLTQRQAASNQNLSVKPIELTDMQKQQRTMNFFMPGLFTFMFYHFASGLNIYWLSSMLLGMLQQWWTYKKSLVKKLPK